MIMYFKYQATFTNISTEEVVNSMYNFTVIKRNIALEKFLQHIVRYRLSSDVFQKYSHWRIISKTTILLIEAEVCRVKMEDERWWFALEFAQHVFRCFNYTQDKYRSIANEVSKSYHAVQEVLI